MFNWLPNHKEEIYNERAFQFEMGEYLKKELGASYKIQYEFNTKKYKASLYEIDGKKLHKRDIDIAILQGNDLVAAIELKAPQKGDGAYPRHMYNALIDIRFMEQLVERNYCKKAYAITVTDDKSYWLGDSIGKNNDETKNVYKFFRNSQPLKGEIYNPTGEVKEKNKKLVFGERCTPLVLNWQEFKWTDGQKETETLAKMYIVKITSRNEEQIIQKCMEIPDTSRC